MPVAALVASLAATPAAAQRCPTKTFLSFENLVYAAERVPASVSIPPGRTLGDGTLDEPTDESGCKRGRESVTIVRASTIDPGTAVAVNGRPRTIFVLGARCAGYGGRERFACLLEPLVFDGRQYTGTRYPAEPAPRSEVPFGDRVGETELGGAGVTVVALEGVDPSLAVGVRGRPAEAFLAPRVCPYERFENVSVRDDLLRCLRAPVWLAFDPPGADVGAEVLATSDRPLRPELAGATISLVRLREAADAVPRDRSGAVRIGEVRPRLRLTVPDVPPGLYEAVVSCPRCAPAYGGATLFPAGSLLVFEEAEGSTSARIAFYALGIAVLVLALASVVVWRRGRRRRATGPGRGGS